MNPEPIDEAHVTRLFAKSERAEHKQPILRSTRPRWLRLTVGEEQQRENRIRRMQKRVHWALLALFGAACLAMALRAHFRSTEPEKPSEREIPHSLNKPAAVWGEDGKLKSYSF